MTLTEERGTLSPSCIPYLPLHFNSFHPFHPRERERERETEEYLLTSSRGNRNKGHPLWGRRTEFQHRGSNCFTLSQNYTGNRSYHEWYIIARKCRVKILLFVCVLQMILGKWSHSEDGLNTIMLINIVKLIKNKWKAETYASVGTWNSIIYHSSRAR